MSRVPPRRIPQPDRGEPCLVEDLSVDPELAAEAFRAIDDEEPQ